MKNNELKDKEVKTTKNNTKSKNTDVKKKSTSAKKNTSNKEEVKRASATKKVEVKESIVEEKKVEKVTEVKKESKIKNISDIILVFALIIVVIIGLIFMSGKKPEPTYELPLTLSGEAGLHQLTYQEYQEKVDNDEEFVIILERATCSHCVTYMPIARDFALENEVPMYYVDTDTFTADDWSTFEDSNSYLRKANGNWGTPTTLVLAGSEVVDYIEGASTADSLLELYNEYFDMDKE